MISPQEYELIRLDIEKSLRETNRHGIENLIDFMSNSGYYDVPASRSYHHNFEHGLMLHSYDAMLTFKDEISRMNNYGLNRGLDISSLTIIPIVHDLCKYNQYFMQNGSITHNPEELSKGHGLYSIEIASRFINLTLYEKAIIKFHMGPYYSKEMNKNGEYTHHEMIEHVSAFPHITTFWYADVKSNGTRSQLFERQMNHLHTKNGIEANEFTFEV